MGTLSNTLENKTGTVVALYYTGTFRGTLLGVNWAVSAHWRLVGLEGDTDELAACRALTYGMSAYWASVAPNVYSAACVLTKCVAQAYNDPAGFYEAPQLIAGGQGSAERTPSFVAKGIRQFRSNADFKTSTHRLPEVMEKNNADGVWVFAGLPAVEDIAAMTTWWGTMFEITPPDSILTFQFQPVLIRTQNTVKDPVTGAKTTTYFNPHQISDVAGSGFYGITSQVSRKRIPSP